MLKETRTTLDAYFEQQRRGDNKRCTVLRPKRNVAGNVNTQVQCVLNNFECHDQEPTERQLEIKTYYLGTQYLPIPPSKSKWGIVAKVLEKNMREEGSLVTIPFWQQLHKNPARSVFPCQELSGAERLVWRSTGSMACGHSPRHFRSRMSPEIEDHAPVLRLFVAADLRLWI